MDYVRRNEDRQKDNREIIKKMELEQEDMARMHVGSTNMIGMIFKILIWIAIIYVLIKVIPNIFSSVTVE